jgi:hypothetical protein
VGQDAIVSANTGEATLPITIALCETDPARGQCVGTPTAAVATQIAASATPAFGAFVAGTAPVPFEPAANHVFVRLKDRAGVTRGAAAVAVRSQ